MRLCFSIIPLSDLNNSARTHCFLGRRCCCRYSILDTLEEMRGADGLFEFKLHYPGLPSFGDMHWKQSVDPFSGESLLLAASAIGSSTDASAVVSLDDRQVMMGWHLGNLDVVSL